MERRKKEVHFQNKTLPIVKIEKEKLTFVVIK